MDIFRVIFLLKIVIESVLISVWVLYVIVYFKYELDGNILVGIILYVELSDFSINFIIVVLLEVRISLEGSMVVNGMVVFGLYLVKLLICRLYDFWIGIL